jgi:DeoR family transcriptional regulator of aga operon
LSKRRPKLLVHERRREIINIAKREGRVSIQDLVQRFRVSAVTLRADLGYLSSKGLLLRSYGGAVLPQEGDIPLDVKKTLCHEEKSRIGRAAAQLIKPHQTIILDSGTTSAEVARAIKKKNITPLNIITHALNIAQEFSGMPQFSLVMIGGIMRHAAGSFVGPQAERFIQELHADHLFLGVDGLDPEAGLFTPDMLEAQLNSLMIAVSTEVTVIADASKLGRRSLSMIADISRIHRLITDNRANEGMIKRIRQAGVEVVVV